MKSETVAERFALLINDLGVSKNAFAKSLGRTATVVQHLIDGRNKPGFDLLETLFTTYPNVSKDWLMLGKGPRYTNSSTTEAGTRPLSNEPAAAAEPAAAPGPEIAPQPTETSPKQADLPPTPTVAPAASAVPSTPSPQPSMPETPTAAAPVAASATSVDTSWQTALYTQQMAHQLAMAELRNQHLQEQQRLMQQMLDLLQRQMQA